MVPSCSRYGAPVGGRGMAGSCAKSPNAVVSTVGRLFIFICLFFLPAVGRTRRQADGGLGILLSSHPSASRSRCGRTADGGCRKRPGRGASRFSMNYKFQRHSIMSKILFFFQFHGYCHLIPRLQGAKII